VAAVMGIDDRGLHYAGRLGSGGGLLHRVSAPARREAIFCRASQCRTNIIGSFTGRLRNECLNGQYFRDVENARGKAGAWRRDRLIRQPDSSLGIQTPFASAIVNKPKCTRRQGDSTGKLRLALTAHFQQAPGDCFFQLATRLGYMSYNCAISVLVRWTFDGPYHHFRLWLRCVGLAGTWHRFSIILNPSTHLSNGCVHVPLLGSITLHL
jgi:hypothetical protein